MKAKYFPGGCFLSSEAKPGSPVWRAFLKTRDIFHSGFEFQVGDGQSSLWYRPWCSPVPLCQLVPFVDIHDIELRIRDIWDNGVWRLEWLWTQVPGHVGSLIRQFPARLNARVCDGVRWKGHISGNYSTSSGYNWLLESRGILGHGSLDSGSSWGWIWRLKAPLKCIIVIWLACHNALPTNECRFRRGMSPDAVCRLCNTGDETVLHCLRDCSRVQDVWRRLGFDTVGNVFSVMDSKVWLRSLLQNSDPTAVATLWWIWRRRNTWCMENQWLPCRVLGHGVGKRVYRSGDRAPGIA